MKRRELLFILVLIFFGSSYSTAQQERYQFVLKAGRTEVLPMPLSLDIEGINLYRGSKDVALYRLNGDEKVPIACQMEEGEKERLWFIPDRIIRPEETVNFEFTFEKTKKEEVPITAVTSSEAIMLKYKDKNILRYYSAMHPVPEGVDALFVRSGFIHPVWSPAGKVLTQIQPADHYHHYGIWNPWTRTKVEGEEVDFWNLGEGEGTVRFAGVISTVSGPVFGGFKVKHEHVVLKKNKTAINEVWDVRSFACRIDNKDVWVIDFTTILRNALDSAIELTNYRYGGGIGFRATEKWRRENCSVLTSEGKRRKDADGTRARWCDVNGETGAGEYSGIVFLSHFANRDHPEPMRVWPLDAAGGKGYMFFEFCPIRIKSWSLQPDKRYDLRYRMIVYDGKMSSETAEAIWQNYVRRPAITLKK